MANKLNGIIVSYRRGPKTQNSKECLLRFPSVESAGEAGQLIGRKVAWPVKERKCRWKIIALHGKNGIVRARFRKGVPGHASGSPVEILG